MLFRSARPNALNGALEREIAGRMSRYTQLDELDVIQRFALFTWQQLRGNSQNSSVSTSKESAFAILHAKAESSLVL